MKRTPDISFVITGFNVRETVLASVRSALAQENVCHEVVYVDDGSTDGSADLVAAINDSRLTTLCLPRVGRAGALNCGIQKAAAPLIGILDADDLAMPVRASAQLAALTSLPEVQVLGGQIATFTMSDLRPMVRDRLSYPTEATAIDAWVRRGRMPIAHPACVFRKAWFWSTGGYDPSVRRAEDFDLLLRGWAAGTYSAIPIVVTRYRTSSSFPSWPYWRREEDYRRAVYRRWRSDVGGPLEVRPRFTDIAEDAIKWTLQRCRYASSDRRASKPR